jgi:hypothetical protein
MEPKTPAEVESNVLSLKVRQEYNPDLVPHDIAHPASRHYALEVDDPLSELLNEFNELVDDPVEEDYIFHHQKPWDYQVNLQDDLRLMADTVLGQIKRLKEDAKRLKYYLDEMNLD